MTPIAGAMTAALGAAIVLSPASAAPGDSQKRTESAPPAVLSQTVAATANGFVIRDAALDRAANTPAPPPPRPLIPVGAGLHLDARLLSGPAGTHRETSHADR